MLTRMIILPVAVAASFAVSGCFRANEPEQAPPPRAQGEKTKAELLVGKWKLVKRTPPNPGGPEMIIEYTQDGNVTLWINERVRKSRVDSGTYRVEGNTIYRTFDVGPVDARERNATIDSITEDKLVTSGSRTGELQVHEFERVRGN